MSFDDVLQTLKGLSLTEENFQALVAFVKEHSSVESVDDSAGLYAYLIQSITVQVPKFKDKTFVLLKVGKGSDPDALADRVASEGRQGWKNTSALHLHIPGAVPVPGVRLTLKDLKAKSDQDFIDHVRGHSDTYSDMVFVFPTGSSLEKRVRSKLSCVKFGSLILDEEHRTKGSMFLPEGVKKPYYDSVGSPSSSGWDVWLTQGYLKSIKSFRVGPTEIIVMLKKHAELLQTRWRGGDLAIDDILDGVVPPFQLNDGDTIQLSHPESEDTLKLSLSTSKE